MKLKSRFYLKDQLGNDQIIRKFLWFPRRFNKDRYWRWLKYADIIEEVREIDIGRSYEWGKYSYN